MAGCPPDAQVSYTAPHDTIERKWVIERRYSEFSDLNDQVFRDFYFLCTSGLKVFFFIFRIFAIWLIFNLKRAYCNCII